MLKKIVILILIVFIIPIIVACGARENKYNDLINVLIDVQEEHLYEEYNPRRSITIKGAYRTEDISSAGESKEYDFYVEKLIITENAVYIVTSSAYRTHLYFLFCEIEYIEYNGEILWAA